MFGTDSDRSANNSGAAPAPTASPVFSIFRYPAEYYLRVALTAALVLSVAYALASLWLPFGWDHGMMAVTGETLAEGGVPYRDSWDVKGPLAFLPIAVAYFISGNTMWGIRFVELLILVPALIVLYRTVSEHTTCWIGAATRVALYLWVASAGWFFTGQSDVWAMALATVAACRLMPAAPARAANRWQFLFVGFLIGCCGAIKPVFLALGLVPLAYLTFLDAALKQRLQLFAWLIAGIAVPHALVLAFFLLRGGLSDLIEVQLTFNLGSYQRVGGQSVRDLMLTFKDYLSDSPLLVLLPIAFAGLHARRADRITIAPLVAWLLAAGLALFVQRKLYTHHWFALFPPVLILTAFGVHALAQEPWGGKLGKVVAGTTACVFAFLVISEPAREVVRWARHITGTLPAEYYSLYDFHTYNVADGIRAAEYIRTNSAPDDGVFVWGNHAMVRFLADRPNPTRFEYDLPLTTPGALYNVYRAEMIDGLTAEPPAFIVVGSTWHGGPKEEYIAAFPEFKALLKNTYRLEKSFGFVDLYRRVGHEARNEASTDGL